MESPNTTHTDRPNRSSGDGPGLDESEVAAALAYTDAALQAARRLQSDSLAHRSDEMQDVLGELADTHERLVRVARRETTLTEIPDPSEVTPP